MLKKFIISKKYDILIAMIKEITKEILNNERVFLEQIETREIFDEIYQGLANEITTTAFIVALKTLSLENETLEALIEASVDAVNKPKHSFLNNFQTINLNPNERYFDTYFAVDIINSANNINSIKYSVENFNNSYFKELKNYININPYSDKILEEIEEKKFSYFYLNENEKYIKYISEIRKNLNFENVFDLADYFLNPFSIKNQMIGVNSIENVQKFANLSLLLNYDNSLVVTSSTGLPFAALDGENTIAEAWKNKIFTYTLSSELLDLPKYSIEEIKINDIKDTFEITKNVFKNKKKDVFFYTIVLNSALALYISKNASSLVDGIKLAENTIESGLAEEKLTQITE